MSLWILLLPPQEILHPTSFSRAVGNGQPENAPYEKSISAYLALGDLDSALEGAEWVLKVLSGMKRHVPFMIGR
jgi:hypothetical protein